MAEISYQIPMAKRFFPGLLSLIGDERYKAIAARYQVLYANHEFPKNPGLQRHLIEGILPGLALYQILRENGESQESALLMIDQIFEELFSENRSRMKNLGKIPFIYSILRLVIIPVMRQYPPDGWKIEWLQNDRKAIRFNMNSCFYFDTLKAYGTPELTASFCRVDDFIYENMSQNVHWQRYQTIARGHTHCDFCFANKGKLQN